MKTNKFNRIKADIWALGVTLFCITFGMLPFAFDPNEQIDLTPKN